VSTLDQIADQALPAEARAAADAILARQVELATRALAAAEPGSPVCSACLYLGQPDETDFGLPTIALVPESWRQELLERMTPAAAFRLLFNPEAGPGEWVEPEVDPMHDAGAELVSALDDAGVWDHHRWLLCRVARALTLAQAPDPRTPDYLAFVFDQTFDHALTENLRFAAPPAVAARWEALGLLPRRGRHELAGARPVSIDTLAAVLDEEVDDEMTEYMGTFTGLCPMPGAVDGVWSVPLEAALAWAVEHTDVVRLRVGEDEYSAGPRRYPGLPPWPAGRAVGRRPI
jgi:hypothetical protein